MSSTMLDLLRPSELTERTERDTDSHWNKRSQSALEDFKEIRRVQKKRIERRRRSRILDKMMNLYRLTMELIGKNIQPDVKLEKVDILGTCYTVFEYVAAMINQQPELQEKLRRSTKNLRTHLRALSDQKRRRNIRTGPYSCRGNDSWVPRFSWSDVPGENSAFSFVPGVSGTHPSAFGRHTMHSTPIIQSVREGQPIAKHERLDLSVCNNLSTPIHQHSFNQLQPVGIPDITYLPRLSINRRGLSRSRSPSSSQLDSGIDVITLHRPFSHCKGAHRPSDCYSHSAVWRPYLD
ncbi:hypothetical protein P879_07864 [Paragonimus westermani]|uniref:BHLH domain-containing protein n=1 Tax=Paragonimus westermani TaxID=34504 RepID=A0A8T0DGS1_9TREM|nr:hypothetical protein P879_07864 [Paragonimus westermani]